MHQLRAYERVDNFEAMAAPLRFRSIEWKVAYSLDGLRTGAEIARVFNLSESGMEEVLGRLLEHGLVVERELSLAEFKQKLGAPGAEPYGLSLLAGYPAPVEGRRGSIVSTSITRRKTPATPRAEGNGLAMPAAAPAVTHDVKKRFRLKPVIDFIQAHAGGGTLGQLAVYRTFMLVPSELMREAGVQRLDFNDDALAIEDPKLRTAIMEALSKMFKVQLPADYFLE